MGTTDLVIFTESDLLNNQIYKNLELSITSQTEASLMLIVLISYLCIRGYFKMLIKVITLI